MAAITTPGDRHDDSELALSAPSHQTTPDPGARDQPVPDLGQASLARELFWQNVVREMLTSLSVMQGAHPELFDGRTAVLTRDGSRIPIAGVWPMFACGINGTHHERVASIAVECTVFRIATPEGEVFTLPVHEIRSLHTLSSELVRRIEQEALNRTGSDGAVPGPFGFAAFTSAGRGRRIALPGEGAD